MLALPAIGGTFGFVADRADGLNFDSCSESARQLSQSTLATYAFNTVLFGAGYAARVFEF